MVELEGIAIEFPGFSLGGLDLTVDTGEFSILMGPTGAGKSLALEAIAGLLPVSGGKIRIKGIDVTNLPPEKRGVGIVYQDFALFPHLTVIENIKYGLRYQRKKNRLSTARIRELMENTGIEHLSGRNVTTLSGGEKQRVALVRALSTGPSVLLLDEPLSALDRETRDDIRRLLKKLHKETSTTFLMVTHDFTDALFLGQRAAVINNGRIEQAGSVREIFARPKNLFVAGFVGIPNVFPVSFEKNFAVLDGFTLELPELPGPEASHIAIRPEDILIHRINGKKSNILSGKIIDAADLGSYGEITVQTPAASFKVTLPRRDLLYLFDNKAEEVNIEIPPEAVHIF